MNKRVDIMDVKAAVKRGELSADVYNGFIRLMDTQTGECVVIGDLNQKFVIPDGVTIVSCGMHVSGGRGVVE